MGVHTMTLRGTRFLALPSATLVLALFLGACSAAEPSGVAPTGRPGTAPAAPGDIAEGQALPQAQPERKLTYGADVELRAKDPWAVAEQARRIPGELGGDLLSMVQSGESDSRSARLSMRVPAAKFEDALARLRKLDAEVTASSVETKDVTDQFVDLNARLVSKQREEQQYLTLLSQSKTVDETLKVSQALARVRTEIEQIQGQLKALTGRIDYSRISVTINNVADITTASAWQPARTAARALVTLVSLLKVLGDLVIWLVIVGWLPAVLLAAVAYARRLYLRRFPPRTPLVPPAPDV
jgi:uncharacterized coiled-coil protein SlyX